MIFAIFFLLNNVPNVVASSNSNPYELRTQDHRYLFHASGSICAHQDEEYTINQTIETIDSEFMTMKQPMPQ